MIEIGIIDDHVIVREGLNALLNNMRGIHVVGEASTGKEGLQLARKRDFDLILLDFLLPDSSGLAIARKLLRCRPTLRILILTRMMNDLMLMHLLKIGVHGYLSKDNTRTELEHAIRIIHSGQRYLSPEVANRLALNKATKNNQTPFDSLSTREMEVLLMVAKGVETKRIAEQLFISTKTVNSYRYRAFEKLQVKNDIELVKLAIQYGLVEIDQLA